LIIHRAAWVLPIAAPPIRNGWVAVDRGRILGCGSDDAPASAAPGPVPFDGQPAAIMPGLVNAHTHLELSYLRGRVPPCPSFDAWVRALVALRRRFPDPFAAEILEAVRMAIGEARVSGTAAVGDIANSLISIPPLLQSGIAAHVFHEVLGFNLPDVTALVRAARQRLSDTAGLDGGCVRASIAPHAPYSVSPALFEAIASELGTTTISSIHLGESPEEVRFLQEGGGPIQAALEQFGAWHPQWVPPGCGPLEYIERFGLLSDRMLIVHGVQLSDVELSRLAASGATLVTCPRSNRWVGVGDPPVTRFYASGVRVAIGTDSLASVEDLNLFAEMAAIRRLSSSVPPRAILESATRIGAEALGFADEFGTIEPGKRAALVAVRIPAAVEDVEEYLVGGIAPAQLAWLDAGTSEARNQNPEP
jgi:aminodeoxyfutalosine deaminase